MSSICEAFKSLLPNGKIFNFNGDNNLSKIATALCQEPERLKSHFNEIRNSGIPSLIGDDFLSDWEDFLGIKKNMSLTNAQRQERIIARYISVGGQGKDYIEGVLNYAGFNVKVYENNPADGIRAYTALMGDTYMGDTYMGDYSDRIDPRTLVNGTLIAGSPDYSLEKIYLAQMGNAYMGDTQLGGLGDYNGVAVIPTEYTIPADSSRSIFFWFIAGETLYNFVDIPAYRKDDFIELILQIKPIHTWCIAQINWI